jgi:hypothetical protein
MFREGFRTWIHFSHPMALSNALPNMYNRPTDTLSGMQSMIRTILDQEVDAMDYASLF